MYMTVPAWEVQRLMSEVLDCFLLHTLGQDLSLEHRVHGFSYRSSQLPLEILYFHLPSAGIQAGYYTLPGIYMGIESLTSSPHTCAINILLNRSSPQPRFLIFFKQ